jgi:hypothetical protein
VILTAVPHAQIFNGTGFYLAQNDPNPFNGMTKIKLSLHFESKITVLITNPYGKVIDKLVSNKLCAGIYEIQFYANGLPGGTYFYHIVADNFFESREMEIII